MYELNWLLYVLIKKMYFYRYSNYHLIKKKTSLIFSLRPKISNTLFHLHHNKCPFSFP